MIFVCTGGFNGGGRGGRAGGAPSFFCNHLFFCNHFEELQTVLFEIELIINNKPLTYVYPNTIETPNHVLFGRKLFYSSKTRSSVVRNITVLSSTTDKINRVRNHILNRLRHGYVVNLRETQRTSKLNKNSLKINVNDIVLDFYEKVPRNVWRIAIVTRVLPRRDSEIR